MTEEKTSEEKTSEEKDVEEEKKKAFMRPPEPEGGPLERTKAFLEERFTMLRPKKVMEEGEEEAVTPVTPATAPTEKPEVQLPADFRRRLIREYRQKQREQLKSLEGSPAAETEEEEPKKEGEEVEKDAE